MAQAKIIPKLRLAVKTEKGPVSTGPHRVKIIEDKITNGKDGRTGQIIQVVRYMVEENGTQKIYDVPVKNKEGELHYLIQRLSEIEESQEVILEMKKSGPKNYVSVTPVNNKDHISVDEEDIDYGDDIQVD